MSGALRGVETAAARGGSVAAVGAGGFILGYLLFALGILSIVTLATSQMIGKQDNAKWIASAKDRIYDQANIIMTQLTSCAMLNAVESEDDIAASYPAGANVPVSSLVCPGTSETLWDTGSGSYMPSKVSGFSDWKYYKWSSGSSATVYFYVTAEDPNGKVVLSNVGRRLGDNQSNLSQTSTTSDTLVVNLLQ